MNLNLFKCKARIFGSFFTRIRFCASCKLQHVSQKNLSTSFSVSVLEKLRIHADMLVFCSISRLRSRNVSSRLVTDSQHRHLVSFVMVPWKTSCIQVRMFWSLSFDLLSKAKGREALILAPPLNPPPPPPFAVERPLGFRSSNPSRSSSSSSSSDWAGACLIKPFRLEEGVDGVFTEETRGAAFCCSSFCLDSLRRVSSISFRR
mmetsp:Transcript_46628/g.76138  ORF Transcript_46628/g.76138 Transcript_46628/m.76138 type:complete len:204 (+) Transcript_46628:702-1313(+)